MNVRALILGLAIAVQAQANDAGLVDRAFFSFDKGSRKIRLRQFHGEGFVNSYSETDPLTFVTDSIENIPAGWRARETYEHPSPDTWSERFELAKPGGDFTLYSASTLQRVR